MVHKSIIYPSLTDKLVIKNQNMPSNAQQQLYSNVLLFSFFSFVSEGIEALKFWQQRQYYDQPKTFATSCQQCFSSCSILFCIVNSKLEYPEYLYLALLSADNEAELLSNKPVTKTCQQHHLCGIRRTIFGKPSNPLHF